MPKRKFNTLKDYLLFREVNLYLMRSRKLRGFF